MYTQIEMSKVVEGVRKKAKDEQKYKKKKKKIFPIFCVCGFVRLYIIVSSMFCSFAICRSFLCI